MHFEPHPINDAPAHFCDSPDFSSGYLHDNVGDKYGGSCDNFDLEPEIPFYVPEFEVLEDVSFLKLTVSGKTAKQQIMHNV